MRFLAVLKRSCTMRRFGSSSRKVSANMRRRSLGSKCWESTTLTYLTKIVGSFGLVAPARVGEFAVVGMVVGGGGAIVSSTLVSIVVLVVSCLTGGASTSTSKSIIVSSSSSSLKMMCASVMASSRLPPKLVLNIPGEDGAEAAVGGGAFRRQLESSRTRSGGGLSQSKSALL